MSASLNGGTECMACLSARPRRCRRTGVVDPLEGGALRGGGRSAASWRHAGRQLRASHRIVTRMPPGRLGAPGRPTAMSPSRNRSLRSPVGQATAGSVGRQVATVTSALGGTVDGGPVGVPRAEWDGAGLAVRWKAQECAVESSVVNVRKPGTEWPRTRSRDCVATTLVTTSGLGTCRRGWRFWSSSGPLPKRRHRAESVGVSPWAQPGACGVVERDLGRRAVGPIWSKSHRATVAAAGGMGTVGVRQDT